MDWVLILSSKVLGEGDDDPQGWLEVVNIDIEGCVLLISKGVISF